MIAFSKTLLIIILPILRPQAGGNPTSSPIPPTFVDLALFSAPGPRTISFSAEVPRAARALPPSTLSLTVRPCMLNEYTANKGMLCSWCDVGFFNLDPDTSICTPCPMGATCVVNTTRHTTDNGVITPLEGMYASNPFSHQIHSCPNTQACTYPDRTERLNAYQSTLLAQPSR